MEGEGDTYDGISHRWCKAEIEMSSPHTGGTSTIDSGRDGTETGGIMGMEEGWEGESNTELTWTWYPVHLQRRLQHDFTSHHITPPSPSSSSTSTSGPDSTQILFIQYTPTQPPPPNSNRSSYTYPPFPPSTPIIRCSAR